MYYPRLMEPVKVLVIGDIHIKTSNITEINIFLDKLKKYLNTESFDFIVSLGDTLDTHERIDSICLGKATDFFELLSSYSRTFVLVGNHDFISNSQFLTNKHWLNPFKLIKGNLKVVDTVIDVTIKDNRFIFVPYVPDGRFRESLDSKLENNWYKLSPPVAIFGHQLFNNVKMGSIVSSDIEDWELPIQLVMGHIHNKQTLDFIYYTGSSMQHAFGESCDKTISSLYFKDKKMEIKEIDLNIPKKKLLYIEYKNIEKVLKNINLDEIKSGMLKIKLSITGTYSEFKSFKTTKLFRDYNKLGIKFEFKKDNIGGYDKCIDCPEEYNNEINILKGCVNTDFFSLLNESIIKDNNKELLKMIKKIIKEIDIIEQNV